MNTDTQYQVGDRVERLIDEGFRKHWEEGYTVIEPPENPFIDDYIYINKLNSRGFKNYYAGVPPQDLRHAANPKMTIDDLLERLDVETDCLGATLRSEMKGDASPVESIRVENELLEGGDEDYIEDGTPDVFVIKSFIVWTHDMIYHSESDAHAFLYEDGRIYSVPRHPTAKEIDHRGIIRNTL